MTQKHRYLLCLYPLVFGMLHSGCGAQDIPLLNLGESEQRGGSTIGELRFEVPIEPEQVIKALENTQTEILSLESSYTTGETLFHDAIYAPKMSNIDWTTEFVAQRRNQMRLAFGELRNGRVDPTTLSVPGSVEGSLRALADALEGRNLRWMAVGITGLHMRGSKQQLAAMAAALAPAASSLAILSSDSSRYRSTQEPDSLLRPATLSAPAMNTWVPRYATVYTGVVTGAERFIQQSLRWDDISGLKGRSYEHEFFVYNYDHKSYFSEAVDSALNCHPALRYSSHNFPSAAFAYLDTRLTTSFTCYWEELEFAFGLAVADAISTGSTYQVYMTVANGNDSSDKLKLQADLGHRWPDSCRNEWCTWSDDHHRISSSGWESGVPGYMSYNTY